MSSQFDPHSFSFGVPGSESGRESDETLRARPNPCRFTIPVEGMDRLIVPQTEDTKLGIWTAAIMGPHGTGKSILSLHIASDYLYRWRQAQLTTPPLATGSTPLISAETIVGPGCAVDCVGAPKVIYVSTDLSINQARRTWNDFGLTHPHLKALMLDAAYRQFKTVDRLQEVWRDNFSLEREISILSVSPNDESSLKTACTANAPHVYFLDLHQETAGDDWGFVNHFMGLLPGSEQIPNLLVIDAVEGLEAFIGDIDSFGETRTRRSRIAQLVRNAIHSYTNVLFVVERQEDRRREPEQFIADYVFTLRNRRSLDYTKRTIEVEKFRGAWHARGEHEISFRNGKGAFSGKFVHYDEPRVPWVTLHTNAEDKIVGEAATLSHLMAIPSLHNWNRRLREEKRELISPDGHPTFGLPLLDRLVGTDETQDPQTPKKGSITFILGDSGTHKSRLATRFLSRVSLQDAQQAGCFDGVAVIITTSLLDKTCLLGKLARHLAQDKQSDPIESVANQELQQRYSKIAEDETARIKSMLIEQESQEDKQRVLCRRLSVRHLSSAHFLKIIQYQVDWAKHQLRKIITNGSYDQCFGHIRLVIDDWNNILETHPNMAEDPMLVQSLLAYLKREGVSAMLVSTQPGQPFVPTSQSALFDLRKFDEQHIYTWNVSFYGERRTALTCLRDRIGRFEPEVYELRPVDNHFLRDECIITSREFGLYSGVESGEVERVPLEIKLVGHLTRNPETDDLAYPKRLTQTLQKVFPAVVKGEVVSFESYSEYDSFSMYADWLDDSRSGKTTILQIDEFWNVRPKSLMLLRKYWQESPVGIGSGPPENFEWTPARDEDTYGVWQPHKKPEEPSPRINHSRDITEAYYEEALCHPSMGVGKLYRKNMTRADNHPYETIDRIPYLWDFGFMLADKELWESCANDNWLLSNPGAFGRQSVTIRDVWNHLCLKHDQLAVPGTNSERNSSESWAGNSASTIQYVSWLDFLGICQYISAKHPGYDPFDVDPSGSESLGCALLEIWSSCAHDFGANTDDTFKLLGHRGFTDSGEPITNFPSLKSLLRNHPVSLVIATTALTHSCAHLAGTPDRSIKRIRESMGFVASRHWYSTACWLANYEKSTQQNLCVLALPGRYTTRGDWYLGVSAGSRSRLLAERVIDLMTSRKMNLARLHNGLGLPVRDVLPGTQMNNVSTALLRKVRDLGVQQAITLGELEQCGKSNQRNWLWRSSIKNYDRDCFYFRRWLSRMLFERRSWMNGAGTTPLCQLFDLDSVGKIIELSRRKNGPFNEPQLSQLATLSEPLGKNGLSKSGLEVFDRLLAIVSAALRE